MKNENFYLEFFINFSQIHKMQVTILQKIVIKTCYKRIKKNKKSNILIEPMIVETKRVAVFFFFFK